MSEDKIEGIGSPATTAILEALLDHTLRERPNGYTVVELNAVRDVLEEKLPALLEEAREEGACAMYDHLFPNVPWREFRAEAKETAMGAWRRGDNSNPCSTPHQPTEDTDDE